MQNNMANLEKDMDGIRGGVKVAMKVLGWVLGQGQGGQVEAG